MKSTVTNELTIPQQTRYLVGIDLGRVERHVSRCVESQIGYEMHYLWTGVRSKPRESVT